MSIRVGEISSRRDWTKIATDIAEVALQALILGPNGFSNAVSALLRAMRGGRGDDSVETRANRLVFETLGYAISATIATSRLSRKPEKSEAAYIINNLMKRADELLAQQEIILEFNHLEIPASFPLFQDVSSAIFFELRFCDPKEEAPNVAARFCTFVSEGLNRIRTRDPDYFSSVIAALSGPDTHADARVKAWDRYRALLIKRFEDVPLFGEDEATGVTLSQVYQPLRAWWDDDDSIGLDGVGTQIQPHNIETNKKVRRYVRMLDDEIIAWIGKSRKSDQIRLVSGGPGSGKSTFARHLAARLAQEPRWRVIFVPLQRLKGAGPLETRIDDYFRLQGDEPFNSDTAPLVSLGRDGHRDWVIIFDGLDELAKEGPGSESAAQDFASALADWRGRIGDTAVRFIVLGRAPSMQEARRRLGLQGAGTLNVADMLAFSRGENVGGREIVIDAPGNLQAIDQRPEFWRRWAAAKGLSPEPPEAMKEQELDDLTKEPLLAYLLILSGYATERWEQAADNRNRIYQAIFDQIWERERSKSTRIHLNDLGQDGFETLMQALGLAAWRGGGRTGDEITFTSVRDTFMRQDLLAKAKACGAADLSNVALLFYTRKDEEGGRGYEFLHKSFGEYLTARGLLNAFHRWGDQMADPILDFDTTAFLRRWLKLSGPAPMTREILAFLRNEVRLESAAIDSIHPWEPARKWVRIAELVVDAAARDGLPAYEGAAIWSAAETYEKNAEISLMAILDASARAAYPIDLQGGVSEQGGWEAGPVHISVFEQRDWAFGEFVNRLAQVSDGFVSRGGYPSPMSNSLLISMLSRLCLRGARLTCCALSRANLEGVNFEHAYLGGAFLYGANLEGAYFRNANLQYSVLENARCANADFRGADLESAIFILKDLKASKAKIDSGLRARRAKGASRGKNRRSTAGGSK